MSKERRDAAEDVAKCLKAAEQAIDVAIASTARLTAALPEARLHVNIAAEVGHNALERTGEAHTMLIQARRQMVEAHRELAEAADQIGLGAFAFGGLAPKPEGRARHLRLASRSAA